MTMPDLFEQLDSPAETGDDWIRRLLSEPDETPSPTPAAGDDGTDTGHEPDLPQEEERIVPPQASGPGAGGDVTVPPPPGAHAIPLPASDDTSPSDDLDDMHQDAIPGFGTDMDADEPARAGHAVRIVLTVLAVVAAVALVGVIAAGAVTARNRRRPCCGRPIRLRLGSPKPTRRPTSPTRRHGAVWTRGFRTTRGYSTSPPPGCPSGMLDR